MAEMNWSNLKIEHFNTVLCIIFCNVGNLADCNSFKQKEVLFWRKYVRQLKADTVRDKSLLPNTRGIVREKHRINGSAKPEKTREIYSTFYRVSTHYLHVALML